MIRRLFPAILLATLAACGGSLPVQRPAPDKPAGTRPRATDSSPQATAETPATATTRRGGYYQDDGPAAQIPENLDNIPDAEPKWEPLNRGTARPYVVFGKSYTPLTNLKPYKQKGIASWYGKKFHGQKTSSGERYDMFAMTAAHTVLPIPSYVRVTNPATGKSIVVRVNDRGPFHSDRIIDLSYTAAQKLGYIGRGSTEVEIELIIPGEPGTQTTYAQVSPPKRPASVPEASPGVDELAQLIEKLESDADTPPSKSKSATTAPSGIYLQLGAFGNPENAENFRLHVERDLDWITEDIRVHADAVGKEKTIHRVQAGPFANRTAAEKSAERVREAVGNRPTIVTR